MNEQKFGWIINEGMKDNVEWMGIAETWYKGNIEWNEEKYAYIGVGRKENSTKGGGCRNYI